MIQSFHLIMRKPASDGFKLVTCINKSFAILLTSFNYLLTAHWLICITETQTVLTMTVSTTPKKQVRGWSTCFGRGISPPPLMAFNRAPAFWLLSSQFKFLRKQTPFQHLLFLLLSGEKMTKIIPLESGLMGTTCSYF